MNRTHLVGRSIASRLGLAFSAVVAATVFACGMVWAQTREGLAVRKREVETSLRVLQQGDSHGVLAGWFDEGIRGKFHPVPTGDSRDFPTSNTTPVLRCYFPISPQKYADELAVKVLTGEMDVDEAVRRARAVALMTRFHSREVAEGIERLKAELESELVTITRELANANSDMSQTAFLAGGTGVLKTQRDVPEGPIEISETGPQSRDREIKIQFSSGSKYAGPLESFDTGGQIAVFKVVGDLGASRQRGHVTVNRRANTVSITMKEVFRRDTNAWQAISQNNWSTESYKLAWGERWND